MLLYAARFSQPMAWTLGFLVGTTVITNSAIAAPPVDSTQDGPVVNGGTYYNTFLGKTTFTNSNGGGLWLKAGTNIRGLEVGDNGQLTNNGGTLHFYAPNNVVRLDGNINVSGLVNGTGTYLGNGGKVFVDSGYLFQNGNIYANGVNGGLVQANVAGMTVGSGAHIDAKGFGGNGGAVLFASSGPVDIRRNAVINTSGKVAGMVDTNVIAITGSLVNQEGVLNANGASQGGGSRGGTIQLTATGQSDLMSMKNALTAATGTPGSHAISPQERAFLLQRNVGLINNFDGDVRVGRTNNGSTPVVTANGTGGAADPMNDQTTGSHIPRAGDGGTIVISAVRDIVHEGQMQANGAMGQSATVPVAGGYGGTVTWLARRNINNSGSVQMDGGNGGNGQQAHFAAGGNGGLAAISYGNVMQNSGLVSVNGGRGGGQSSSLDGAGGNGGLMVFSGNQNPVGNGFLLANGGLRGNLSNPLSGGSPGTIVVPDPLTIQSTQHAVQVGFINGVPVIKPVSETTQANELLTHAENLIFLARGTGSQAPLNVFDRLPLATLRSVADPTGTLGLASQEITIKARPDVTMDQYVYRNWLIGSIGANTPLDLTPPTTGISFAPMSHLTDLSSMNLVSVLNKGDISVGNNASSNFWMMGNIGILSGRRLHLMAEGNVTNTTDLGVINDGSSGGSLVLAATGSIQVGKGVYGTLFAPGAGHAGTMILKAKQDIAIGGREIFDGIVNSTGGLIGGASLFQAGRNFTFGNSSISTAGDVQGGWLNVRAGNNLLNNQGNIVASGSGGVGGFIALHADNSLLNARSIAASGRTQGGTIMLTAGDLDPNNNQRVGITSLPVQFQGFGIPGLTPPLTPVFLTANGQQSESVFNLGNLDVRADQIGCNTGKIYLGGNNQVVLGGSNIGTAYNRIPISYQQITGSSDPNAAFQAAFNWATNAGEKIYAVAGQQIPGGPNGTTRTATEIVEVEAGPNGQAPNVNPAQAGQGASVPSDFEL
jgi:hypothetical protein